MLTWLAYETEVRGVLGSLHFCSPSTDCMKVFIFHIVLAFTLLYILRDFDYLYQTHFLPDYLNSISDFGDWLPSLSGYHIIPNSTGY